MRLKTLDAVTGYDRIYLSPHPDDVVLSCGGALAVRRQYGVRQIVVTLCSAVPPEAPRQWQQRMHEDARALRALNVDSFRGGHLDAPYRHRHAYRRQECLFAPPVPEDTMPKDVALLLAVLADQNPRAILCAPLGVGSHVDHLSTFGASDSVTGFAGVDFYEDLPYPFKNDRALEQRLAAVGGDLKPTVVDISHGFDKKLEAVAHYLSQVHFLFGGFHNAAQSIIDYARQVLPGGVGERTWARPGATSAMDRSR